jgi:hypothetical protein
VRVYSPNYLLPLLFLLKHLGRALTSWWLSRHQKQAALATQLPHVARSPHPSPVAATQTRSPAATRTKAGNRGRSFISPLRSIYWPFSWCLFSVDCGGGLIIWLLVSSAASALIASNGRDIALDWRFVINDLGNALNS